MSNIESNVIPMNHTSRSKKSHPAKVAPAKMALKGSKAELTALAKASNVPVKKIAAAKPAATKPEAKAAQKAKPAQAAPSDPIEALRQKIGVTEGSQRSLFITALLKKPGEPVSAAALAKATGAEPSKLANVARYLTPRLEANGYTLTRSAAGFALNKKGAKS